LFKRILSRINSRTILRAGEPRSYWVYRATFFLGIVSAFVSVGMTRAGLPYAYSIGLYVFLGFWLVSAIFFIWYLIRLFTGHYNDLLAGRSWSQLPW